MSATSEGKPQGLSSSEVNAEGAGESKRNISLDLMRVFGLLALTIGHANPPLWLFQLRNFGAPFLVFVSGLTFSFVYYHREIIISVFYKKRIQKLLLPTYTFLTVFFIGFYFWSELMNVAYPFSAQVIAQSYFFDKGIGFVWVLKVYLITALLLPFAMKFTRSTLSNSSYYLILLACYIAYELVVEFTHGYFSPEFVIFLDKIVFVGIAYFILFLYGLRVRTFSDKTLLLSTLGFFAVFAVYALNYYISTGSFVYTQGFKYPPRLYYIVYAMFAIQCCWIFCKRIQYLQGFIADVVAWVSRRSLWIYLWHILGYYIWKFSMGEPAEGWAISHEFHVFVLKFILLIATGTIMTQLQFTLVRHFIPKKTFFGRKAAEILT